MQEITIFALNLISFRFPPCYNENERSIMRRNLIKKGNGDMKGFQKGANLGGWLSQCSYERKHMDTFIEEPDFAQIAEWGFDHVRIPFDYNILENEDGSYNEEGFARLEKAVAAAKQHGLNVVLDLHKTAGFSFDFYSENESGFFESEACQERFYRLWEAMAARFGRDPEHIVFELLNEVTDPAVIGKWNSIIHTCISRIRRLAPETKILVGSYWNNSALSVKDLDAPYDSNIVYNFHCYEPLYFTHQGAVWTDKLDPKDRFSFEECNITPDYFEELFSSAIEKAQSCGAELYCGEYGVIDTVSPDDTVKWFRTIHSVLDKYGIGRSVWSYKRMNFGLTDARLDGVRDELLTCF